MALSVDGTFAADGFVVEPDLPLSTIQRGILTDCALNPAAARYNVPLAFKIDGFININVLSNIIDKIVQRHETLRTIYPDSADGPLQAIAERVDGVLRHREDVPAEAFERLCREEAGRPFDLTQDLPLRATLFSASDDRHALCLVFHHIAIDGWSIRLLLDELARLYTAEAEGFVAELPVPDLQYADWAGWQQDRLNEGRWAEGTAAVLARFDGIDTDLGWPARDVAADALMRPFGLDRDTVAASDALARSVGTTLYAVLAGAFALAVSRISGERSLVFGTPVVLRDRAEVQGIVGCFVNTVPVRIDLNPSASVAEYLRSVGRAVVDGLDRREVPFDQVVRRLPGTAQGRVPLRVFFNFDDAEVVLPRFDGCTVSVIDCDRGTAKFDLMLSMLRTAGEIRAGFDVATDVIDPDTLPALEDLYRRLLRRMAETPERPVAALGLLDAAELREVLASGKGPAADRQPATVVERIFRVADGASSTDAVIAPDGRLSFGELAADARALALLLSQNGVDRGSRVVVCLPRSVALPTAMLAAMSAGGAYVPLEPDLPDARLRDVLEDADPAAVLCASAQAKRVAALLPDGTALLVCDGRAVETVRPGGSLSTPAATSVPGPSDLAYMIYTSGSTGRPKGVMVPHAGLVNYLDWALNAYAVGAGPGSPVLTSTAFDATVLSFWAPLLVGSPIELLPEGTAIEDLSARLTGGAGFAFVKMTPAHLDLLADLASVADQADGAQAFVIGGEALLGGAVEPWRRRAPGIRLINEYGPTETVVGCCVHEVGPDDPADWALPIGRPIDNCALYVLDGDLNPLPAGMTGELFIGGAGVAWGYWRRPGLTAERFLADPFAATSGARMYRTGDRVRMRPDGVFEYFGRADDQLKLRGYRIEPGEIEAAIRALDGVQRAAVVPVGTGTETRLIAYQVGGPDEAVVRDHLSTALPAYMVPDRVIAMDALPLTANGKVDRRALQDLEVPGHAPSSLESGDDGGAELAQVIDLWAAALSGDAGPDTDFFAAGGSSLSAIRLLAKVKRAFDVRLGYPDLTAAPTPRRMAERLRAEADKEPEALGAVLEVVRGVMDDPSIGPDDDIFAAGGTSLKAVRILARLRRNLSSDIPADTLHRGRSARGIAVLLDEAAPSDTAAPAAEGPTPPGEPMASPAERQLWLDSQVDGGDARYVMQAAFAVPGRVQPEAVDRALAVLADRHPVLRTAYRATGDGVEVRLLNTAAVTAGRSDAGAIGLDEAVRRLARRDARRPFDPECGETWRLSTVDADGETGVVVTLHHAVSDAVSLGIVLRDLTDLLAGRPAVPAPQHDYRTYAADRLAAAQANEARCLEHWRQALAAPPTALELPLDRPRQSGHMPLGGAVAFRVAPALAARIDAAARRHRVSVHAVLTATYSALLHRLSGAEDVVIGVPVSDRPDGFEDVVGMFLNTLPLRLRPREGVTADALIASTSGAMADLLGHADAPLSRIVEAVNPVRQTGRTPLLQTVLDWREEAGADAEAAGVRAIDLDVATAPFDLAMTLRRERDGSLLGGMIFDRALLDGETVSAWGRSFVRLLEAFTDSGGDAIGRLPAVDATDLPRAVLVGPASVGSADLSDLLNESANRHAARPAVDGPDGTLSYRDLWARANDVPTGSGVAMIDTADPVDRVVTALAAVLAGRPVALLDPALPAARLDRMRDRLTALSVDAGAAKPERSAYVQFTSGSTGEPKAAVLSRSGLANLAVAISRELAIGPGSRVVQVAAPAFDAWIWEVFTTLVGGGTLVLAERADLQPGAPLAETLRRRAVSHATLTPSAIGALSMTLGDADLPDLTVLVAAGEPLAGDLVDRWAPGRRMVNAYGPCEATVCTSLDDCRVGQGAPTIGFPIAGMTAMVVDRHGQPVPAGVRGELLIGGIGVGLGYLGDADLTAERFTVDPRPGETGRVYRSGDFVRVRSDGRIQFLGREDRQVKVRGVRIELDEVEAALMALDGVDLAAVRVVHDTDNRPAVAAWVAGPGLTSAGDVRAALSGSLPETMLPAFLSVVERMPMTATGKVDRMALPDPHGAAAANDDLSPPIGPIELAIAEAAAEILGLDAAIGRHQSFFTLGGHSLLAVRLAGVLERRLERPVPLPILFAHPSPAGLAAALTESGQGEGCSLRTLRDGDGGSVYLVHSVDGTGSVYADLAALWPGDRRVVAVEQGHPYDDLEGLVRAYAARLRDDAVGKRIRVAGWSMGAVVAAALAKRLRAEGADVDVVLIDATPPAPEDADLAADERGLAEAAERIGGGADLVTRVRRNVRLAADYEIGTADGSAAVIRSSDTDRPGVADDLGWSAVFDRVTSASVAGGHNTILHDDPATVAARIEALWLAMETEAEDGER